MYVVSVYVTNDALAVNKTFSYKYDEYIENFKRVKVIFNHAKTNGIVVACVETNIEEFEKTNGFKLSSILEVLDSFPIIDERQFELAKWLSKTTISPFINCLNSMLPKLLQTTKSFKEPLKDELVYKTNIECELTPKQHQILSLIYDVLDMSRIESGKLKIEESNVYLPSILDDIRDIVSSNVQKKQLNFNIYTVDLKDSNVLTDPLKLKQVLLNVVANAIKFTPSGGYVNLSLVQKDGYGNYDFIVEDNGIGISKEFQEHIFEQFSREATSTVSRVQGTGLGLSISKAIVDMMGGSISVESKQGKGSKFTISLCFKVTDETTDNKTISSNSIIDTNKKILLVEDNELNYEIAKTVLEEASFIVDGASNGKEAVDKVSDNTYDVILMDIQMPIMDGYEATKELRRLGNSTPIIAMTANAFSEDRKKAKDVGMDGYIAKPIDVNKLVSTIVNILSDQ